MPLFRMGNHHDLITLSSRGGALSALWSPHLVVEHQLAWPPSVVTQEGERMSILSHRYGF